MLINQYLLKRRNVFIATLGTKATAAPPLFQTFRCLTVSTVLLFTSQLGDTHESRLAFWFLTHVISAVLLKLFLFELADHHGLPILILYITELMNNLSGP